MNQADSWTKISEINEAINPEGKYHPLDAELEAYLGPSDDYCEVYRFPCCEKQYELEMARYQDSEITAIINDYRIIKLN